MHLMSSRCRLRGLLVALAGIIALPAAVAIAPDDDVLIAIAKHAELTADGSVVIRVHIACDPLPGTEDFQEAHAGVGQARTGAGAEGGIDGVVVCDGTARTHTAHLFPIGEEMFARGPARANASLFVCHSVEDQQICIDGRTERRILIKGPPVRRRG